MFIHGIAILKVLLPRVALFPSGSNSKTQAVNQRCNSSQVRIASEKQSSKSRPSVASDVASPPPEASFTGRARFSPTHGLLLQKGSFTGRARFSPTRDLSSRPWMMEMRFSSTAVFGTDQTTAVYKVPEKLCYSNMRPPEDR